MKRLFALLLCMFGLLAAPPVRAEVELSFDFYYDQLSPMGEWAEVDGYGYVWHPNGVDGDWAPYTDGYWSYTDAGWTWVSYEDWGGITYHYGRWTFIEDYGWCWVPGYEWGPAWVSWRKSDEYVGWAPLPPECDWEPDRGIGVWADVHYDIGPRWYNFCHFRNFGAPVLRHVLLPRIRNVDICFGTVNITNITFNRGYGCVYNGGFDYDYVRERCERPVPTLRLVQNTTNIFITNNTRNVFVNAPRGNALIVAAPRVAVNARVFTRKPAIRKTFDRSVVARGWNNLEKPDTRDRLVSKMRSETKGLTPTNAPARPVRQEALAVVPKEVDLDARPAGFKRVPNERPARPGAKPGEGVSRADVDRDEKGRPNGRGESAAVPMPDPDKIPGRQLGSRGEAAGADKENRGGLRTRPNRDNDGVAENQGPTSREADPARSGKGARPERIVPENVPATGKVTPPETRDNENKPDRNNRAAEMRDAQENARRQAQENAEKNADKNAGRVAPERMNRGNAARESAEVENAAREKAAKENNAARDAAERQAKQREQAEAAREGGLRGQRQREAAEGASRTAEMQREAQENANEKARQNAARESASRAEMQRDAREKAQEKAREDQSRQNAIRANVDRENAAAAAAARRAQMQNDNAERMEKQRRANDQAEAAQRQAGQREAAQRAAAERQQDNARRQAMERQQENAQRQAAQRQAEAQQQRAAQQAESRQRASEAARERANDAQRQQAAENARARAMENQQRAQQAQGQARAQAQRESQQRAASEAAARRQSESRPQRSDDDKNDKKKGR